MATPTTTPAPVAEPLRHGADACEQVAEGLRQVSAAAAKLLAGPLTRRALALLIRDALPRGSKMDPGDILEVLDAAAGLAARNVRRS